MAGDRLPASCLEAALEYAERGFAVLPVRACAKVPLTAHGLHDATRDEATIRASWAKWPSAGVAIATGTRSGLAVVDIDPGGEESLVGLVAKHEPLPCTLEARTPRGGRHLYFRLAESQVVWCSVEVLRPGLDVRGEGGYVVAPPSPRYTWAREVEPSPLPVWLAALIEKPAKDAPSVVQNDAPKIREGERNSTLTSLAGTMRRRSMTFKAIFAALLEENRWRCDPPLPQPEVERIAASISGYAPALIAPAPPPQLAPAPSATVEVPAAEGGKRTQATRLIHLVRDCELFHAPEGTAYATVPARDHAETWPVKSSGFRQWLARRYYFAENAAPSSQALHDAITLISSTAKFDGCAKAVFLRVGELDGNIYVDLCDENWQVVEITPAGWQLTDCSPVKFRRSPGTLPLPEPKRGGSIAELRSYVNFGAEENWALIVAWLVGAMRPRGPYPILCLHGEQGSAKSTTDRVLRALIDPYKASMRSAPRDIRDLFIAANNSWVLALDNVSHLDPWLSDALCTLATGGGLATRELYSDSEEVIFDAQRPTLLNGIEDVATRADFLERSIILYLPKVRDSQPEDLFWPAFEATKPRIFGALLDTVSTALRNIATVQLKGLPRMADFTRWGIAAEPGLMLKPGTLLRAYELNRRDSNSLALEASVITGPVRELVEKAGQWRGTANALLKELNAIACQELTRQRGWPKAAAPLSNRLRRLAPNLRAVGVQVVFDREGRKGERLIRLENAGETSSAPSAASAGPDFQQDAANGHTDEGSGTPSARGEKPADDADIADSDFRNSAFGLGEAVEGEF